ncbi:hypothetical protein KFK09_011756 [Dendrobium nobile]|uniref:Homeobox domain-containing protein n=1 Tax=Dendrobium nobile TaxID=94219 RepID=A0A8T3BDJ9_DENNO|nr:hypothetical protein KFK09_011756 [Dendrobium nobile]
MGEEEMCDTTLGLGIGKGGCKEGKGRRCEADPTVRLHLWFPSCPKKEIEEEHEEERKQRLTKSKSEDDDDNKLHGARKKLRLNTEQSSMLEESFRAHNTLTSHQKEELAQKLGLFPRQVEVWFQNRRARTKLKQTEVDCEVLRTWCESLRDENRRLRMELQELRFYTEVSKVEETRVCSSCEELISVEEKGGGFVLGKKRARVLQLCN